MPSCEDKYISLSLPDRLNIIRSRLIVPKKHFNRHGGFYYRSCEDILNAVKPLLIEQGINLYINDSIVSVGDRIYVKATVLINNDKNTGIETHGFARDPDAPVGMSQSQATGSASSYARKYALCALFLIDDMVDPDTINNTGDSKSPSLKNNLPTISMDKLDSPAFVKRIQEFTSPYEAIEAISKAFSINKIASDRIIELWGMRSVK